MPVPNQLNEKNQNYPTTHASPRVEAIEVGHLALSHTIPNNPFCPLSIRRKLSHSMTHSLKHHLNLWTVKPFTINRRSCTFALRMRRRRSVKLSTFRKQRHKPVVPNDLLQCKSWSNHLLIQKQKPSNSYIKIFRRIRRLREIKQRLIHLKSVP